MMETNLGLKQWKVLKAISEAGGTAVASKLNPRANTAERKALVESGLIHEEKQGRYVTVSLTESGIRYVRSNPDPPQSPPTKDGDRTILLWLAFAPEAIRLPKPAVRDQLIAQGLVEQVSKKPIRLALQDKGWRWIEEHMHDPIPKNALLGHVLRRVKSYLDSHALCLADLFRAKPATSVAPVEQQPVNHGDGIYHAIEMACLRLGRGHPHERIRLSALRRELAEYRRDAVDRALIELSRANRLVLWDLDDPKQIHAEDREAELRTEAGEPRHIVYWKGN